jgi:hypothetical protein
MLLDLQSFLHLVVLRVSAEGKLVSSVSCGPSAFFFFLLYDIKDSDNLGWIVSRMIDNEQGGRYKGLKLKLRLCCVLYVTLPVHFNILRQWLLWY